MLYNSNYWMFSAQARFNGGQPRRFQYLLQLMLDYAGAPLFATPVIGDIADGIIMAGGLSAITRSKRSTLINAVEFVPVIGDFVPIYTISTLLWIYSEFKKEEPYLLIFSSSLSPPLST